MRKEREAYVLVYWRRNFLLCLGNVPFLETGFGVEINGRMEVLLCRRAEFYLKVTQISGILLALFGIVVMILPFIVE